MKGNVMLWVLLAIGGVLLLSSFGGVTGAFNLAALDATTYGQDNIQRLINLYNAMLKVTDPNTGQPLTVNQQIFMLSQALHESGLFTGAFNQNNIDNLNNWTGIKGNSNYAAVPPSQYAYYPNLDAFVGDWLRVLNYKNQPIEATDLYDYANRLKLNGYYEDTLSNYYTDLLKYYNLLSQTEVAQAA